MWSSIRQSIIAETTAIGHQLATLWSWRQRIDLAEPYLRSHQLSDVPEVMLG
jgi:hypothetical protein